MQASLFNIGVPEFDRELRGLERIDLGCGAWVDYLPLWLDGHESVYRDLVGNADWKQGRRLMYHRTVTVPRLTAAAPAKGPSAQLLLGMSSTLAGHYGVSFEATTLAWYRNGKDSVAPHGDRIGRLCEDTVIAIVSVGAPRRFLLHPVAGGRSMAFSPGWGDLLVMGGNCQRTWLHSVPKLARADPRISIQFRAPGMPDSQRGEHRHNAREFSSTGSEAPARGVVASLSETAALPGASHYG
jgi:alkylated DNA repair dioxygenase AlkB